MDKLADADDILTGYIRTRVKEFDAKKKDCQKQIAELEPLITATQDVHEITGYMDKWEALSVSDKNGGRGNFDLKKQRKRKQYWNYMEVLK